MPSAGESSLLFAASSWALGSGVIPEHWRRRPNSGQNAAMREAQETYNELLKSLIAPGLRAIGFKGSGQNYRLSSDDHWAMLAFQKSTSSNATHVRFTANVLVVSRSGVVA
jgi:Domain of unknown function (DUF4304)